MGKSREIAVASVAEASAAAARLTMSNLNSKSSDGVKKTLAQVGVSLTVARPLHHLNDRSITVPSPLHRHITVT